MKRCIWMVLLLTAFTAGAAGFPERPITVVVAFPSGSTSDFISRLLAPQLSKELGVPIVVENRAGANGSVAAAAVARAPADGYTILVATVGVLAANPWIYAKPTYVPERDFAPVINAASTPNVLVVHPMVKADTLAELVALAKSEPHKLSFASAGNGSTSHLCGQLLKTTARVDIVHVPYRGPPPAMQDLLGATVSMMCDNLPNVLEHVRSGRLKALAVTSSKRSALLPHVPTTAEAGFPEIVAGNWYGFVVPAATPRDIVDRLSATIAASLRDAAIRARLEGLGLTIVADDPERFKLFISQESARMKKVVETSGAKVD